MRRTRMLILLVLVLLAPVLTTVAAERPAPGPVPELGNAAFSADPSRQGAAQQADEDADTQDDRRRKQRGDKPKKPKKPTCFGKKATIILKGDESEAGTPRNDVIVGSDKDDTFAISAGGTDRVCTGRGNDVVGLTAGRLLVNGGRGNDVISASGAPDVLIGGPGRDALAGGSNNDDLFGGEGIDRLLGEDGFDVLDGGPGSDACQQDFDSPVRAC